MEVINDCEVETEGPNGLHNHESQEPVFHQLQEWGFRFWCNVGPDYLSPIQ